MNNLIIQPSFQARPPITRQIKKQAYTSNICTQKTATQKTTFWKLADKFISKYVSYKRENNYSKEPISLWIEKNLEAQGINVRFKNNSKLAQYIQCGIDILKEKKTELPKNIMFMPSILSKLGIFGMTYMLDDKKESPIILPRNIAEVSEKEIGTNEDGYFSSRSRLHIFFHEVGHWLHHQKGFNVEENIRFWNTVNKKEISEKVSKQALQCEDGSDFCAEVIAAQLADNILDENILEIAEKLNAPLIK